MDKSASPGHRSTCPARAPDMRAGHSGLGWTRIAVGHRDGRLRKPARHMARSAGFGWLETLRNSYLRLRAERAASADRRSRANRCRSSRRRLGGRHKADARVAVTVRPPAWHLVGDGGEPAGLRRCSASGCAKAGSTRAGGDSHFRRARLRDGRRGPHLRRRRKTTPLATAPSPSVICVRAQRVAAQPVVASRHHLHAHVSGLFYPRSS